MILVLATLVRLPTLGAPFESDDYSLIAAIERGPGEPTPLMNSRFQLWAFLDGVPAHSTAAVYRGALPWWTAPEARLALLRPLSSVVLTAIHRYAGWQPRAYYVATLAAFLLSIVAAATVLRRVMPTGIAAFATLLFSVHSVHARSSNWISAIHLPLSTALGMFAIYAHIRWRENGGRAERWLSVLSVCSRSVSGRSDAVSAASARRVRVVGIPTTRRLDPRAGANDRSCGNLRHRLLNTRLRCPRDRSIRQSDRGRLLAMGSRHLARRSDVRAGPTVDDQSVVRPELFDTHGILCRVPDDPLGGAPSCRQFPDGTADVVLGCRAGPFWNPSVGRAVCARAFSYQHSDVRGGRRAARVRRPHSASRTKTRLAVGGDSGPHRNGYRAPRLRAGHDSHVAAPIPKRRLCGAREIPSDSPGQSRSDRRNRAQCRR